jgi:glycopeptide antibiotics resistance protein
MVFVSLVILISFRLSYIYKNKVKVVLYKEIFLFFFAFYILCLFQIVTSTDVSGTHGINLTLFKEMTRYQLGTRLFYRNIIGNIIMFIPFGFFTSYYLKLERKTFVFFLSVIVSIVIELIQLNIGRAFDIDDILLNIVGSMLGYFLYRIIDRIFGKLSDTLKGTLIIIVFLTAIVLLTIII